MKIKTIDGFAIVDPTTIKQLQYREFNKSWQIDIMHNDSMGMIYQLIMASEQLALQAIEEILSEMEDTTTTTIEEETYIDGFKAGVEYALKLKD